MELNLKPYFLEVKDVKNEIQKLEWKVTNLFELNEDCSKEQKNQGVACCQLAAVIDWICCCLVGVDQCGPAAMWKLHSDAQEIYKGRNQVVFSVQPIGLPLFHFTRAATKGKKRGLKENRQ